MICDKCGREAQLGSDLVGPKDYGVDVEWTYCKYCKTLTINEELVLNLGIEV